MLPSLSILDLSVMGSGQTTAIALANTTTAAKRAEELGYKRYWVAEHHNFPAVASTSPAVLIAHLAANTKSIKLGSGGVMLPNHAPLVIAEQFALLEALYPSRIDLGIGRAPGTDGRTALALRRGHTDEEREFPGNVIDVMGLLGDRRSDEGLVSRFIATPALTSTPQVVLLGSSDFSAQLAGMLGLPFSFAHHFSSGNASRAVDAYRDNFRPSPVLDKPHLILTTAAIAADTQHDADRFALPGQLMTYEIRRNTLRPLYTVEEAANHPAKDEAIAMTPDRIVGDPDTVTKKLRLLVDEFEPDEVMVTTVTHGLDERLRSMELIINEWNSVEIDSAFA